MQEAPGPSRKRATPPSPKAVRMRTYKKRKSSVWSCFKLFIGRLFGCILTHRPSTDPVEKNNKNQREFPTIFIRSPHHPPNRHPCQIWTMGLASTWNMLASHQFLERRRKLERM